MMEANLSAFEWTLYAISLFLCILSIIGNGFICRAILYRKRKSVIYLLIAYQAMSNIIFGISRGIGYPMCHSTLFEYGRLQVLGCEMFNVVMPTACYSVSAHCMAVMAYYRFKTVYVVGAKKPTVEELNFVVSLIWFVSVISAIVVSIGFGMEANPAHHGDCIVVFSEVAHYAFFTQYYGLTIGYITTCLVPYLATCGFYILIVRKISARPTVGHVTSEREKRSQAQKNRMTKMLIIIFATYYALTLPVTSSVHLYTIITRSEYNSCVVNPVILFKFDETFREDTLRSFSLRKSLKYNVNQSSSSWSRNSQYDCMMEANLTSFEWTYFGISFFLCILSIIGNGLICRTIFNRKRKSIVYLLIAYQAISDIIYGISRVIGFLMCHSTLFQYGRYQVLGCEIFYAVIPKSCYSVSSHCMAVIAYYRYKTVYFARTKKPSMNKLKLIISSIWSLSLMSAILATVGLELDANPAHPGECITLFARFSHHPFFSQYYGLSIGFLIECLVPYVATCGFYILIVKKISLVRASVT
ncbi:hypothetical protein HDE_07616 [Halotydeus destructor]|nr:hypothetical protein HDE_07616 [Halotydeus destructor]